ncbi:endolytic transglycosylase MltG [Sinomonas susongensis]|uniref:endolytic transglycosylase MltG n=1 Tax=Sinomonas susongensis TaxID=1324851 RepID=UPI001FE3A715|nr:endolytic transglycosylase MltG [Sinomonas susongensis]
MTETQQRKQSASNPTPAPTAGPTASPHRPPSTVPTAQTPTVVPSDEGERVGSRTEATPTTPGSAAAAARTRPRTGRTLADWPAPVPASASYLAVRGEPVYEAEERVARGLRRPTNPASGKDAQTTRFLPAVDPASSSARAEAPESAVPGAGMRQGRDAEGRSLAATGASEAGDAGGSVLKRAKAVRAAAAPLDASAAPRAAGDTAAWDAQPDEGLDGRHRNAALRHQAGSSVDVADPGSAVAGEPDVVAAADTLLAEPVPPVGPDDSTVHEAVFASAEVVKAPRRRSRQFKAIISMTIALALIVGACFLGAAVLRPLLGMDKVTDYPGPGTGQVSITVQPGSGPRAVADELQKDGVIADADTFLNAFASTGASLHPGDYTFKKQMKSSDAAAVLGGDTAKVIYFALSAGLRVSDSLATIAQSAGVNLGDLNTLNSQPQQFGLPAKAKNLEGYLAPGEYRFPVGTSAKDIITKLVSTTTDELKQDGITDPNQQYQVLTVASIVQAEGGQADYGNVAGAIYNRLKPNDQTNGLIQSDATVTYGLGTKTVQLTDAQKADASNPYNTYVHAGLPPGPIGSPGSKAVAAAAHPTSNDYLFWVTVNLATGETKFAKTYAEHQANVAQYQQWCTANPGKCQ